MREIEFRAWLKNEKKMFEVEEIIFYPEKRICYNAEYKNTKSLPFHYLNHKLFEDIELMQYTGRKDKNGVKIFEGDIVKLPAYLCYDKEYAICKWLVHCLGVEEVIGLGFLDLEEEKIVRSDEWDDFEVIGNIYENPELLEDL